MKLALLMLALATAAAQELAPETVLVARIKDHLRTQFEQLPDYTCLESVVRYHRQPGRGMKLRPLDHLQLEVLYSGGEEWFGWPGARTLEYKDPARFIGGGMIGNGIFALFERDLLMPATIFQYGGEEAGPGGRAEVRYAYRVPRLLSPQLITLAGVRGTVGVRGTLWADRASLDLVRLEVEAWDIPEYLPLAEMSARMDFTHTRIGAGDVLLAQNADLHMRELAGEENYDRFEFTHCSQFHAQSSVRFEADSSAEAQSPPANRGENAEETADEKVPALLLVTIALTTPIAEGDAVGKPIEGRTVGNVLRKGKIAIPSGSLVHGRLRRLEQSDIKPGYFIVGLEYTEIEIGGAPVMFYADLIKMDHRGGILPALESHIVQPRYPGITQEALETITLPEIPGVASFFVPGKTLSLPAGLQTTWRTRGLLNH